MGERRFGLILFAALAIAGLAGYGVFRFLQQAQASAQIPMGRIVVAAVDLSEGHAIVASDVRMADVPSATLPPGAYTVLDSVIGRVTRIPVFTTEALVPGRLAPVGSGAGLEVKITPGKRAMAVRIDDVVGLSGLIQPNSRVDVLVTMKGDDNSGQQERAKLFMSNMRVLSVGSQIERASDGRPMQQTTAALEVTPAEAEQLAVATNQGKIQLVLRGYGDPDTVATAGASMRDISLGRSAPSPVREVPAPRSGDQRRVAPVLVRRETLFVTPPVAAPAPRPRADSSVIQVYRGAGVTQQRIEKKDSTKP